MLKKGLTYMDDDAVDALIRRPNGTIALVQIKARSQDVTFRRRGTFRWQLIPKNVHNWFVFYSLDAWIISLKRVYQRKLPKHEGQGREPHHLVQRNAPRQRE